MKNCFRLCLLTAVLLAMGLLAAGAGAQVCLYMDFDDDADPWTIVTQTGDQPAWVWFVLEVPPNPPVNRNFEIWFQEGCCDHNWIGYYGMHIDYWTSSSTRRSSTPTRLTAPRVPTAVPATSRRTSTRLHQ